MKKGAKLATELRIGNFINTEYGILSVLPSMLFDIASGNLKAEGIPLTEDLFKLLPFWNSDPNNCANGYWYPDPTHTKYSLSIGYVTTSDHYEWFVNDYSEPMPLLTVHQLQNLVFALSGEELHFIRPVV